MRRAIVLGLLAFATSVLFPAPAAAYDDEGYLGFADRVTTLLEPAWSAADGYYVSGSPGLDSRLNAAMLVVFID